VDRPLDPRGPLRLALLQEGSRQSDLRPRPGDGLARQGSQGDRALEVRFPFGTILWARIPEAPGPQDQRLAEAEVGRSLEPGLVPALGEGQDLPVEWDRLLHRLRGRAAGSGERIRQLARDFGPGPQVDPAVAKPEQDAASLGPARVAGRVGTPLKLRLQRVLQLGGDGHVPDLPEPFRPVARQPGDLLRICRGGQGGRQGGRDLFRLEAEKQA